MKHLFLDDAAVERQVGLQRRWHQPEKLERPVLEPEVPVEGNRLLLWNAPECDLEQGTWRMWYTGSRGLLPRLAQSEDGLHWTRPQLGLVADGGETDNNIVNLGFEVKTAKENRIVLVKHPDPQDPRPYKALTRVDSRLYPLESRDGLTWERLDAAGPASGDEYRLAYDPLEDRYIATAKLSYGGRHPVAINKRTVGLALSEDLRAWSQEELVLHADETDQRQGKARVEAYISDPAYRTPLIRKPGEYRTDVYNMPVFVYEGLYLGLPVIFNQTGRYYLSGPEWNGLYSNEDGFLYPQLAVSRDLQCWERPCREPFIPISPVNHPHLYDDGAIYCCPPLRHDGQLWFYYAGRRYTHLKRQLVEVFAGPAAADQAHMGVFLARLREDGFVSWTAGEQEGFLLTRPLTVGGSRLMVNADAGHGTVRAELIDAETGRVLQGFSAADSNPPGCWRFDEDKGQADTSVALSSDTLAGQLCWQGNDDLSALRERQVRIRFFMQQADLYSFWFSDT